MSGGMQTPKFHIVEEKGEYVIRADCGGVYGRHATLAEARAAQADWENYFEEPLPAISVSSE